MTTAFNESQSSIRLNPRYRSSEDSATLCGSAIMEHSEPLLGEEARDQEVKIPTKSTWSTIPFWRNDNGASPRKADRTIEADKFGRRKGTRRCLMFGVGFLAIIGVVQILTIIGNLIVLGVPDRIHDIIGSWGKPGHVGAGLSHWPTDFTRDILPITCHSHNDYWRAVPLYSAIEAGCISVEGDIWLFTDELYVGHSVESLTPNRTLDSLYVTPLVDILSKQNQDPLVIPDSSHPLHGVFDTTPEQPLIFLIDFKTSGTELFPHVVRALEPLRSKGYLTRWNGSELVQGPIIVVGTGETPFDMVRSENDNPYQDIFFDAPLNEMYENSEEAIVETTPRVPPEEYTEGRKRHGGSAEGASSVSEDVYNTSNSYYASVSFTETIGILLNGEFSDHQMQILRGQVKGAHQRGLKARYWELPFWPVSLRNHVWDVLVKEGVDLLNVDDLEAATKRDWSKDSAWS